MMSFKKCWESNTDVDFRMPPKPWSKFIRGENQALCHEEALDLLSKMLVYDHAERILPKEALEHKYFDPVRNL